MKRGPKGRSKRPSTHALPPERVTTDSAFFIDEWLKRHARWVVLLLVVGSIGVRAAYFLQLIDDPGIELHRWDQTDMGYYDAWGRRIAKGDWLSASVTVPMHAWHHRVAERYFADHPEMRGTVTSGAAAADAAEPDADTLLWTHWMGGRQFYQDPLYPYLVGLTYRFAGDDARYVFVWQMALGVLSNVLIWLSARRFFGDTVAACAAVLALLCGPLVYYELLLLRESTIVFAALAIIWLADRALMRGGAARFAILGATLGLAALLKSSLVLLGIGVVAGIVVQLHRRRRRELWLPALATVAGLAIALLPLAARNLALGVPPLALASSGGFTFMISNDATYDPKVGFHIDVPRFADLMNETGGRFVSGTRAVLGTHTPASYATLLLQKLDRAWHWFELPNNDNFYYMRLRAPILRWLPVTFWLCSPLALIGLALGAKRSSRAWLLYILVASCLLPLVAFYVLGRFRIALVAAVMPFAALTLVQFTRWIGSRQYLRVALAAAAVLAVASWTGRPLQGQPLIGTTYWLGPFITRYEPELRAAMAAKDLAKAASAYVQFFQYEPTPAQLTSFSDAAAVQALARMHADCASLLRASGQGAQSTAQAAKARELLQLSLTMDSSDATVRRLLADSWFEEESYERAAASYEQYLAARPDDVSAMVRRGVALAASKRSDEAARQLERAIELNPRNAEARRFLAVLLMERGDAAGAAVQAEQAVELRPRDAAAHDLLGRIWASQGKTDAAKTEFEKSLQIDPTYIEAREHLNTISRVSGQRPATR